MVSAHLRSLEHNLDGIAERFAQYPNFNVECAARVRIRSVILPTECATFFKHRDRILYGVDMSWKPYREKRVTDALRQGYILRRQERYRIDWEYFAGTGEMHEGRTVQALGPVTCWKLLQRQRPSAFSA